MPLLRLVVAAIGALCPYLGWELGAGCNKTAGVGDFHSETNDRRYLAYLALLRGSHLRRGVHYRSQLHQLQLIHFSEGHVQ